MPIVTAGALVLGLVSVAAGPAQAVPGTPSGGCERPGNGTDLMCSFVTSGAPEVWTVPQGVSSVVLEVFGAAGGAALGGKGGRVSATLATTPGQELTLAVGAKGGDGGPDTSAYGGGAAGGDSSPGGGGASVVSGPSGPLIVAGGGGGAGIGSGGVLIAGGDGGAPSGTNGQPASATLGDGAGGGGGTVSAGGAGGAPAPYSGSNAPPGTDGCFPGTAGVPGASGQGGSGGEGGSSISGGGGGGGYYGGGGGGAGAYCTARLGPGIFFGRSGGGGGGSSWASDATPVSDVAFTTGVRSGNGLVTVTYASPDPDGAPTVSVNQAAGQPDPAADQPILFDVVFSEPVSGFGATDDVELSGTASPQSATISGGPTIYQVAVSDATSAGLVVLSIPAGVAIDDDLSTNVASTSVDNTVSYEPDVVAPVAAPTQSPAATPAGWATGPTSVAWNWADTGSGIDPDACVTTSDYAGPDGAAITLTASCTDLAGNAATASYTLKVDATKPALAPVVAPDSIPLGGTATATPGASDDGSGIAVASCGPVDTSVAGPGSVTCTATDRAGNTSTASVSFTVSAPPPPPVRPAPAPVTIQVKSRAYFALGSTSLSDRQKRKLRDLVSSVPADATVITRVTGVVRAEGATKADRRRATARAKAVRSYLTRLGLPGTITVSNNGRTAGTTPKARRANITLTWTR